MKNFISIIILVIMVLTGCKQIILWKYGIHNPQEETPESILSFMEKMSYPTENTFIFKDSSAFYHCIRDSVFRRNTPGTLFFSPEGLLDTYKDTSKCQWSGGYFVSNLRSDTIYRVDTAYTLQKLMSYFIPLNKTTSIDTSSADYIVVIAWATFLGQYNERLFSICKAIQENKKVTVKPVFLCTDIQKAWNLTREQQQDFRIN